MFWRGFLSHPMSQIENMAMGWNSRRQGSNLTTQRFTAFHQR
jgi:hypothetical protein